MPIFGEDNVEPNDSYVEQLVQNAEAIVKFVVSKGINSFWTIFYIYYSCITIQHRRIGYSHPDKIAVAGHSYGVFSNKLYIKYNYMYFMY